MKLTKEQLEYELVIKHFELRDGELWVKDFVDKRGNRRQARPAKGIVNSYGYLRIWAGGKWFLEHRVIFILTHNRPIKEGHQIHHIYNNKTDNRIEHLEEVSHRENCQNRQINLDGKLPGVRETKYGWQVRIYVNGKNHYLGTYDTPEESHDVYKLAVEEVNEHGCLIRTNAERAAAAGAVLRTRGSRLRNTEQRGECEALEYYQLRVDSKRG